MSNKVCNYLINICSNFSSTIVSSKSRISLLATETIKNIKSFFVKSAEFIRIKYHSLNDTKISIVNIIAGKFFSNHDERNNHEHLVEFIKYAISEDKQDLVKELVKDERINLEHLVDCIKDAIYKNKQELVEALVKDERIKSNNLESKIIS